jgi:hypothetical protein
VSIRVSIADFSVRTRLAGVDGPLFLWHARCLVALPLSFGWLSLGAAAALERAAAVELLPALFACGESCSPSVA